MQDKRRIGLPPRKMGSVLICSASVYQPRQTAVKESLRENRLLGVTGCYADFGNNFPFVPSRRGLLTRRIEGLVGFSGKAEETPYARLDGKLMRAPTLVVDGRVLNDQHPGVSHFWLPVLAAWA